jgi:hypothetical protein|tara:strand:+ start:1625 stop:1906 length:282 start_codon:yes stop_codon:yes gene_type:complete
MRILRYYIFAHGICMGFVQKPKRVSTSIQSIRKDPLTGKIYIGEPDPLEDFADSLGELLDDIGRAVDRILGPKPIPIPIPIPVEDDTPHSNTD